MKNSADRGAIWMARVNFPSTHAFRMKYKTLWHFINGWNFSLILIMSAMHTIFFLVKIMINFRKQTIFLKSHGNILSVSFTCACIYIWCNEEGRYILITIIPALYWYYEDLVTFNYYKMPRKVTFLNMALACYEKKEETIKAELTT